MPADPETPITIEDERAAITALVGNLQSQHQHDTEFIKELQRKIRKQAGALQLAQAKLARQRERINALIRAEEHCVFRIEADLLREEVLEMNARIQEQAQQIAAFEGAYL